MRKYIKLILILLGFLGDSTGQCFLTGADLSYTNEIMKKGGVYKNEHGNIVDPYEYFASREAKIVRLRLWHTPSNIIDVCGNPVYSGSLKDVLNSALKVKLAGMKLMLSIHYSDYFTNPSIQKMPDSWQGLSHSELLASIANYTEHVLNSLHSQSTLPDIVCIGNETTSGFIDKTATTNGFNWNEDGDKFNMALNTIDSFNRAHSTNIKKAVHFTESGAIPTAKAFIENGIENFDVIGLSFYPFFSPKITLKQFGGTVKKLDSLYTKEVIVIETGFAWTNSYTDNYENFLSNNGSTLEFPMSEKGQKEFLLQLAEAIEQNNGKGLLYWEPAFITSDLCDFWGQGSSYENAAMYNTNNQPLESFDLFQYCGIPEGIKKGSKNKVEIFVNPIKPYAITVKGVSSGTKWEITGISGRIAMNGTFEKGEPNTIEIPNFPRGIYLLRLSSNLKRYSIIRKLVTTFRASD